MTIIDIKKKYHNKIDLVDLDLIIAFAIKKEREFVLAHPEHKLTSNQQSAIIKMIARRLKNEPLGHILGEKEFYGLKFKVNQHTLIPRPETELMVELALEFMKTKKHKSIKTLKQKNNTVIDIGTGSGNIIISILKNLIIDSKFEILNLRFFGVDISKKALMLAKQNAKLHNVHKKIKFLHGSLLDPVFKSKIINHKSSLLILANLPYLSKDIYNSCADNVKKYEPKTALYSAQEGLSHYDKLLKQIKSLVTSYEPCPEAKLFGVMCFMEISPEQKKLLLSLIKKYFPQAKIEFKKDLAGKWRICKVEIGR